MPRYFFDVHDGADTIDEDGIELNDVAQAKIEAASFAASLLRDDAERFWSGDQWTVRVRDASGLRLFELMFVANVTPALTEA